MSRCFSPPIFRAETAATPGNMQYDRDKHRNVKRNERFFFSLSLLYMWKCKYLQNVKSIKQNGILTEREHEQWKLKHPEKSHSSGFDGFIMFDWVNVFSIYIFYLHMFLVSMLNISIPLQFVHSFSVALWFVHDFPCIFLTFSHCRLSIVCVCIWFTQFIQLHISSQSLAFTHFSLYLR